MGRSVGENKNSNISNLKCGSLNRSIPLQKVFQDIYGSDLDPGSGNLLGIFFLTLKHWVGRTMGNETFYWDIGMA